MIRAVLPESRTHPHRVYNLADVNGEHDALLTIQQGCRGPKGGTAHIDVESYDVQEVVADPEQPFPGRCFLLCKDSAAEVYEVYMPSRTAGHCTCKGFKCTRTCKHFDALHHLVFIEGWVSREMVRAGVR